MHGLWKFLSVVVIMALIAAVAFSQAATTGTITSMTSDTSGALIPGVNVVLKFPARISDQEMTAVTDERGMFRFPAVPTAVGYQLRAELTGFRPKVISDVEVRPGITQNFPIVLEVGALTEEVTVTAQSPLINLDSAQVSEGLNEAITSQVPLVRRDFTEIAQLFQGIQHSAGYRTFTTSEETESQQRCTIPQYNVKNTRTYGARTVVEIGGFLNRLACNSPPEAQIYHSKGRFTGTLRSFDQITHRTVNGTFTTGPKAVFSAGHGK